jgi:hypothetical protein
MAIFMLPHQVASAGLSEDKQGKILRILYFFPLHNYINLKLKPIKKDILKQGTRES